MTAADCRSPSLAGISSDPSDPSKRLVAASTRPDGSLRKELRVRPGFIPSEDVAKYKVGGGSIRSQHLAAQANFQAPPSPSPASRQDEVTPRRPNPSDFIPREKPVYPAASPSKPSRSGASSSKWASAPAAATSAPADKPSVLKPTRGRGGKAKGQSRGGISPALSSSDTFDGPKSPDLGASSAAETESVTTDMQAVSVAESASPTEGSTAQDPISLAMEWPDDGLKGEWWEDEPDLDLQSTLDAFKGVSLAEKQTNTSLVAGRQQSAPAMSDQASPPKAGRSDRRGAKEQQNGKGRPTKPADATARKSPPSSQKALGASKMPASNLLSRMEPRSQEQAAAQVSDVPAGASATGDASPASASMDITLRAIGERAAKISAELRQIDQLKRFEASGAVLMPEQKGRLAQHADLANELRALSETINSVRDQVEKEVLSISRA